MDKKVQKIEEEINFIVGTFKKLYSTGASYDILSDFLWLSLCPNYYDDKIKSSKTREELYSYVISEFPDRYKNFLLRKLQRSRQKKSEIDFGAERTT